MNFDKILGDALHVILSAAKNLMCRTTRLASAWRSFAALRMTGMHILSLLIKVHYPCFSPEKLSGSINLHKHS